MTGKPKYPPFLAFIHLHLEKVSQLQNLVTDDTLGPLELLPTPAEASLFLVVLPSLLPVMLPSLLLVVLPSLLLVVTVLVTVPFTP